MKKIVCILLAVILTLPLAVSCSKNNDPSDSAVYIDGISFTVRSSDNVFQIKQINSDPVGENIVVYTHDYLIDGKYAMHVGGTAEERTYISIRAAELDGEKEFDIVKITDNGAEAIIPYNGFALSVPKTALESVKISVGQLINLTGYEKLELVEERTDLASFSPAGVGALIRRIGMVDPKTAFKDGVITFVSGKTAYTAPADSLVAVLNKVTTYGYEVVSIATGGDIQKGTMALIFSGEYNKAYAESYVKVGEKLMFSGIEKANGYSELPVVIIDGDGYEIPDANVNADSISADGVYLYTKDFSEIATPAFDGNRVDVAVVSDRVAFVSENTARTLIPTSDGFTLSFVGSELSQKALLLTVGEVVQTALIETEIMPEKYLNIDGKIFSLDFLNGFRQPEGVSVLYTPDFGETTGTNDYGTEIVVEDGRVISVSVNKGNNAIPKNGFVLSIHKDHDSFFEASRVKEGETATLSLTGSDFSVTTLNYDAVNEVRKENFLVVYRGLPYTGTNVYGYEIIVDKNGTVIGDSIQGNSKIPEGGFVLSGHGTSAETLQGAYMFGQKVILNGSDNEIVIIRTPDLKIGNAKEDFKQALSLYDDAKKQLKNLDYKNLDISFENLEALLTEAKDALSKYDFETAINNAVTVSDTCDTLLYSVIESRGAENRAMWYRSNEKSDEEVRQTINKLKLLNVNALYIETWYDGYCIGQIDVDGVKQNAVHDGYDVLEGFIRIGHENGIEVHAWVENFFIGYYDGSLQPSNQLLVDWSEKILIDKKGRHYFYYYDGCNFGFLNPYDRECRDFVLEIYRELITKYDLDGLHLDYIRFPELNYQEDDFGYNADIIAAFAKKTGIKTDPRTFAKGSSEKEKWDQFRREIITSFVEEVYEMVTDLEPELWLSAATYPDVKLVRTTIFQDVATWVENDWLDEVFSMSYGADNVYVKENAAMYSGICKGHSFYSSGIQAFADTAQLNFAYQLTEVTQAGADGVSVFSLGSITPNTYQNQIVYGAFRAPSVQVNRFNETVKAQADYVKERINNVSHFNSGSGDVSALILQLEALSSDAAGYKLSEMTSKEKIAYARSVSAQLDDIITIAAECFGTGGSSPAKDLTDLKYWLDLSANRLETKLK